MKPDYRAPPGRDPSAAAVVGYDGATLFDAPHHTLGQDALAQDSQALHMAIPRGQAALSPSIPPGPMPQTPKHLRDQGPLSLQSIQSMRGLHSARSVPDFHDLYDVPGLDIPPAPEDPFMYEYEFQDQLSPPFYEMPLSSSQTLVLTSELSSVGSGASGSSSFLSAPPPPVEGLGIAEPGWAQLSPRSRVQQNQPRVTKKASKQTLRQKRSRANLDQAAAERPSTANGSGNGNPNGSSNGSSNGNSNGNSSGSTSSNGNGGPVDRPSSPAPSTSTSSSAAFSPPFPTSPRSPTRASATRIASAAAMSGQSEQQQLPPMPNLRHVPSTPFPMRGKAAASPAMQSPMRPSLSRPASAAPRLQAAAAATALYTPAAPSSDASRRTSMAAAAAAAAASATQQSTTPGSRTPRVSPSTIVASSSGRGPQQSQSAASPTPAARMHSSSKLVSVASDSSPAKGMFSQAQTPIPLTALPKPVQTARKMPSNQSIRRNQARKAPNVIPEMSSAMNQFQIELKPQQPQKRLGMPPGRSGSELELMHGEQHGHGPIKKPMAPNDYQQRSHSVGPHLPPRPEPLMDMNQIFFDAPSQEPWLLAHQHGHAPPPSHLPPPSHSVPVGVPHSVSSMPHAASLQHPHIHALPPQVSQSQSQPQLQPQPQPQPQPQLQPTTPGPPQFTQMRPKTVVPVSNETSRVHPQGEPPQHVWVAHPPPPRTPRRRTPRQAPKQTFNGLSDASNMSSQPERNAPERAPPMSAPVGATFSSRLNTAMMKRPDEVSSAVPIPPHSAPESHAMTRPLPGSHLTSHPSGEPTLMTHPPMTQSSAPGASMDSNAPHPPRVHHSIPSGLAMPPDMFSGLEPEPYSAHSNAPHENHPQEASSRTQEDQHPQESQSQEFHPLSQLNDALPSDGDYGFNQSIDYSNQEFLDTLEWVPNELDPQWDFMDVLDHEI